MIGKFWWITKRESIPGFYRQQRSWGKVIFSQAYVILFTGGGSAWSVGGSAWSWGLHGPGGCEWSQRGAWSGGCLVWGDLVQIPPGWLLLRATRILLECILVAHIFENHYVFKRYCLHTNGFPLFATKCNASNVLD